ncbi:hypothetical protein RN001_001948 [Aquatica leii]|uniref:Uncharacterized protein n=1 Tax=Aquatica leii TaxID=1421715 RepID=A0AAN7SJU7_9COLE|nr:hypothetical protein RN001_001948 [Aquatica leii]
MPRSIVQRKVNKASKAQRNRWARAKILQHIEESDVYVAEDLHVMYFEWTATFALKLLLLFINLMWLVYGRPEGELYTDQFDNVDIDEILQSDRLLNNYYNCLVTGNKCTPDAQKLRDVLPDALQTDCQKCTEVQKTQSTKVIDFLVKNKIEMFQELEKIFDPNREYRKTFGEKLKAAGIVLPD